MSSISPRDYYRMWRARGIRLPIQYFFQNHLFDIINRTDTHFRLEKRDYREQPEAFESGVLYMSSPTKEVKNALRWIERRLGSRFHDFQFFDLGCGKGKTLVVYSKMYGHKPTHRAIGVEYYKWLADIAERNLKITSASQTCGIYHADARQFHKFRTSEKLILYLYNPFAEDVLGHILESCTGLETYLIYTDPVCQEMVQRKGFKLLYGKKGAFPNRTVSIFERVVNG